MAFTSYVATEEMTNINRVSRLLMRPCTDQLRDLLRFYIPPASFRSVIQRLRLSRLTEPQRKLILPNSGVYSGNYDDMDISLLYILLRNVSGIQAHNRGWGNTPDSADRSVSANIERVRLARNQCGHSLGGMCYTEFNQIWSEIKAAVVDLDKALGNGNKYQDIVDFIRNDTMDPMRDYILIVPHWIHCVIPYKVHNILVLVSISQGIIQINDCRLDFGPDLIEFSITHAP